MSVPRLRPPLRAVRRAGAFAALGLAVLALAATLHEPEAEDSDERGPGAAADKETREVFARPPAQVGGLADSQDDALAASARRATRRAERAERRLAAARERSEPESEPTPHPVDAPAPQRTASPPSAGATQAPQRESFSFEG